MGACFPHIKHVLPPPRRFSTLGVHRSRCCRCDTVSPPRERLCHCPTKVATQDTHIVMGIVEVKDTKQHCFYRAKLLDVKQDNCLVQYEEAEGSTTRQAQSWVHSKLVRREPPEQSAVRIEQVPLSAASLRTRHCASPSCHPAPPPLSAQRCRSAACHPHPVRA